MAKRKRHYVCYVGFYTQHSYATVGEIDTSDESACDWLARVLYHGAGSDMVQEYADKRTAEREAKKYNLETEGA